MNVNMFKGRALAVLVFILAAPSALAQGGLPLAMAETLALENNPGFAARVAAAKALEQVPSQEASLPDPMATFGLMNLPADSLSMNSENMTQTQLGLSQKVPFPGKLSLNGKAAGLMAEAAGMETEQARLFLLRHVRMAWWRLFFLDHATEVVLGNQAVMRQLVRVAEKKYKLGHGLQQDALLAQLELSKLLEKEIELAAKRESAAARLNLLLGGKAEDRIKLPVNASKSLPKLRPLTILLDMALESNPSLKAARAKSLAAGVMHESAKMERYPDFNFSATYGLRGANPATGKDRSDLASLMVGINIPIYSSTKQSRKVAQKSLESQAAMLAYQEAENGVLAEVRALTAEYGKAREMAELYETGVIPQAGQTVESMLAGYQVNKVDFLNLARAQITLYNYQTQYWNTIAEANMTLASLKAATGSEDIHDE